MLKALSIKNFALIDSLEIDFSEGLSVITGETGSGKSILLGALGLVLGDRADLSSLKNKEIKCVIEVIISISKYNLESFFKNNDLDFESETTIRREILPSGKSRAFINDSPVNLGVLTQLSDLLVDIHSQHQTRSISESDFQFEIIDALAGQASIITNYSTVLKSYKTHLSLIQQLQDEKTSLLKDKDYYSFLFEELKNANLKPDEQLVLEEQLEKLNHTDTIKSAVEKTLVISHQENLGVISQLKEVKSLIGKISGYSKEYETLFERLVSVQIEFEDIIVEWENINEKLFDDPVLLVELSQKLQLIYTLQKKHQVDNVEALIEIQQNLEKQLIETDSIDEKINEIKLIINKEEFELKQIANQITENRKKVIPELQNKMQTTLSKLGMPDAQFIVELNQTHEFLNNGSDHINFLFSANKGGNLGLIKKVASGGEMSRIMLSVKALLSEYKALPTIIFDEIDTGVSGEIANKMGEIMQQMSKQMQVIVITHLPQIASKGSIHYKVYKTTNTTETISELKKLSFDERINEIAEMLSGKDITESALIHAKSLLN